MFLQLFFDKMDRFKGLNLTLVKNTGRGFTSPKI